MLAHCRSLHTAYRQIADLQLTLRLAGLIISVRFHIPALTVNSRSLAACLYFVVSGLVAQL